MVDVLKMVAFFVVLGLVLLPGLFFFLGFVLDAIEQGKDARRRQDAARRERQITP